MSHAQQNKWYYECNNGSYRPYDCNVTQWLNHANIGDSTVLQIGNNKYQIVRLSNNDCTQTNIRSRYERKGISQNKRDQIYNNQQNYNNMNQQQTTNETKTVDDDYKNEELKVKLHDMKGDGNENIDYEWSWKSDKGNYIKYNSADCTEIEKLAKGGSYFIFANVTQYEVQKISKNKCKQINIRSNKSRDVIRQSIKHNNMSTNKHSKQTSVTDKWHWMDNDGNCQCMDTVVSQRIDALNIGETMKHNTMFSQYSIKKISNAKAQQTNIQTNDIREIWKTNQQKQYNNYPNKNNIIDDDDEKKRDVEKWYWQTDDGEYKQLNEYLCVKLNNLIIGESFKAKIRNSMYEFKKISIGKGQQRNTQTNKTRNIRIAKYGWFYQENDQSLKPFTDNLSQQITKCQIGSSVTFSLKSGIKYQVHKTSMNQGKQKNLNTKFERKIVYKMTLNDDGNNTDDKSCRYNSIATSQNAGRDWVKEREKKAMKTGKIVHCKLTQKRNLFEDTADAHFRRCESQFMRSCQNLGIGGSVSGLNNTIKEVEYVINPKLIKQFEAKKKKLMLKNKWKDEGKLNIILAWHGTPNTNLNGIIETNFSLDKLASNSGDTGWYGKGIYFSEYAKISLGYGKGLLLCKVMLGKSHKMLASQQETGRACEKGYDSHVVVASNGTQYGQEIVIFDVDQILPCYIVKY